MKQLLTKEDVSKVLRDFEAQGKKVTCTALHAALGNRGSMSTLLKLKAEIEGTSHAVVDSPQGLKKFREVWALAATEERQLQEVTIAQLREEIKALATENERLEGLAIDFQHKKEVAESDRERVMAEVKCLQSNLIKATEDANRLLATLADERASHAKEIAGMREDLAAQVRKVHELELESTRLHISNGTEVHSATQGRLHK